jgi:hypothetical protein
MMPFVLHVLDPAGTTAAGGVGSDPIKGDATGGVGGVGGGGGGGGVGERTRGDEKNRENRGDGRTGEKSRGDMVFANLATTDLQSIIERGREEEEEEEAPPDKASTEIEVSSSPPPSSPSSPPRRVLPPVDRGMFIHMVRLMWSKAEAFRSADLGTQIRWVYVVYSSIYKISI